MGTQRLAFPADVMSTEGTTNDVVVALGICTLTSLARYRIVALWLPGYKLATPALVMSRHTDWRGKRSRRYRVHRG